jgi:hypothetical protein
MAGHGPGERNLDPGIRLVLEELRDLRLEMRADRRSAEEDRRSAEEDRRRADDERRQSDQRFAGIMQAFRQGFRDMRTVGLSIVKTLNHHSRILERIDRKLGARGNGRPGQDNGGARPRR